MRFVKLSQIVFCIVKNTEKTLTRYVTFPEEPTQSVTIREPATTSRCILCVSL